jgi:hypothetical protein
MATLDPPRYGVPLSTLAGVGGDPVKGFIVHHTGGGGTVQGVMDTLHQRGLGVEYVMDRDGQVYQIGGPGSSQIMPGWGAGAGLSNRNTVGMEVIAKNDSDVTPAQVSAAQNFIHSYYPDTPVYGHGQVNPGHKEASEGMTIVNAILANRGQPQSNAVSTPIPTSGHAALLAPPQNSSAAAGSGGSQQPSLLQPPLSMLPPILDTNIKPGDAFSPSQILAERHPMMADAMQSFQQGYSGDRFMSDMFAGQNPMRRMVFGALGDLYRSAFA